MTPEEYRAEFERVWPWLEKSLARYADTERKEHVWEKIEQGLAQLWTTENAAVVTTLERYPTGLLELRGWLASGSLEDNLKMEPIIFQWAKEQGCSQVALLARRGWLRAFDGYREAAVLMVKEIK